jgi:hypothetical protein
VRAAVTFGCMPLLSLRLQWHDAIIGLMGSVLAIAAYLVYAFSYASWMFYLGNYTTEITVSLLVYVRVFL